MSTFDITAKEIPAAERRPEVEQKKSDISVPHLPKEAREIRPQKPDKSLYHSALERLGLTGGDNAEASLAGRRPESAFSSERYEKVVQYCAGKAAEAWDRFQKTGDTEGRDYQEYKSYRDKIDRLVQEEASVPAASADLRESREVPESDNSEANIEESDPVAEKIAKKMSTPEGIKELMESHPEKAELWGNQLEALETLNDPDASPVEIRSAQAKLSILKGQIMEVTAKDALMNVGFDVEAQQRVVEGESGGTRPDVIAVNNTDQPIEVFGVSIQPEETLSIECKCGGTSYMTNQLNTHIPNQLSGQEGTKVLLTTSDIKGAPDGLAARVCNRYDANLVALDVSVYSVEKAIKEVAGE